MITSANERGLNPSGQCDQVIDLKPETCRRCGQELSRVDSDPLGHQVGEFSAFPSSHPVNGYPGRSDLEASVKIVAAHRTIQGSFS